MTTPQPGMPFEVWLCPDCSGRCHVLHFVRDAWHCRFCAGLDYPSRHRERSVPGLARVRWLRRRLGASPELFSEIPPFPPGRSYRLRHSAPQWLALLLELRQLEAAILRRGFTDVLDGKRHAG